MTQRVFHAGVQHSMVDAKWPAFRTIIDNAQMILGKADMAIARRYIDLVPDQAVAQRIFATICQEHERSVRMVKAVAKIDEWQERIAEILVGDR